MVSSAKVTISEIDKSSVISSMEGIYAGIVVSSDKGPTEPYLITSETDLINVFGKPNPKLGPSMYSAIVYLNKGNKLWVSRAIHDDAKYAGVLIRTKVNPPPQGFTNSMDRGSIRALPISGLTQAQLDSYQFPTYITNKVYESLEGSKVIADAVPVDATQTTVQVNSLIGINKGDLLSFTNTPVDDLNSIDDEVGENTPTYEVTKLITRPIDFEVLKVEHPQSGQIGDKIFYIEVEDVDEGDDGSYKRYKLTAIEGDPILVKTAETTSSLFISNTDFVDLRRNLILVSKEKLEGEEPEIKVGEWITTNPSNNPVTKAINKSLYTEDSYFLQLAGAVAIPRATPIVRVIQAEIEHRDAFLIVAANQGTWGNNISVSITEDKAYDTLPQYSNGNKPFFLTVYDNGVQVEQFEVTRDYTVDGYGNQMYIEDKINGKSRYIVVKNNPETIDQVPLYTDSAYWVQNPEDVFNETGKKLVEPLLKGHVEVKVSDSSCFEIGDRIRFPIGFDKGENLFSAEYKVAEINSAAHSLKLDRAIVEKEIKVTWTSVSGMEYPTTIFVFDQRLQDEENGIVNGVKYFKPKEVPSPYPNNTLNDPFVISGLDGILLDAGANKFRGGDNGEPANVYDAIESLKLFSNREKTPIQLLIQGGWTETEYVTQMINIINSQGTTHGFVSIPKSAEESFNAQGVTAITEAKTKLNLNDSHLSIFTGWLLTVDVYNQRNVWIPPDAYAAANQSFVTKTYSYWTPSAGLKRGTLSAIDVLAKYDEAERDNLVENRINPIRYSDTKGISIWGNETSLASPSPLQMRSVAMLLIKIKLDIEPTLENTLFDLNNEDTWTAVEGTLNAYMRDEIKAKGGVYDYQVKIKDIITDLDLDNRRMPVFIGIKPTSDINFIPVSLTIFNNTVEVSV